MNHFTKLSCLLRAAPQIAVATLIVMFTATSTHAEGSMNLSCSMDKYKPNGRYSVDRLRSWIPDKLRVEVSDADQVTVYVASGPAIGRQFNGEVKRENSNKIVMEATQKVRDKLGQETFMNYTLELFKSSDKLIVNANPQGYRELGYANGKCKAFPVSAGTTATQPSVSKPRSPDTVFGRAPDNIVCDMATENGAWQEQNARRNWVLEAKARGLTLKDC
jgi:hypothetical protein